MNYKTLFFLTVWSSVFMASDNAVHRDSSAATSAVLEKQNEGISLTSEHKVLLTTLISHVDVLSEMVTSRLDSFERRLCVLESNLSKLEHKNRSQQS